MPEYIEREALLKALTPDEESEASALADALIGLIRKIVEEQPAADVAEVRHGYWEFISLNGGLWCSECKTQSSHKGYATNKRCPNCGAIMDGKGDCDA